MNEIRLPRNVVKLARRLRQKETPAEKMMWECLRNRAQMGAKFRGQQPIGRYIADFYCHDAQLVIELDGGVHQMEDQRQYDVLRQEEIEGPGITVFRFNNQDVTDNLPDVLGKIKRHLIDSSNGP